MEWVYSLLLSKWVYTHSIGNVANMGDLFKKIMNSFFFFFFSMLIYAKQWLLWKYFMIGGMDRIMKNIINSFTRTEKVQKMYKVTCVKSQKNPCADVYCYEKCSTHSQNSRQAVNNRGDWIPQAGIQNVNVNTHNFFSFWNCLLPNGRRRMTQTLLYTGTIFNESFKLQSDF